jgi:hypothetical protein
MTELISFDVNGCPKGTVPGDRLKQFWEKFTELGLTKDAADFKFKLALTARNALFGAPKKFKNWPRPLFRPRIDHACPQKPNPSRETVPLSTYCTDQEASNNVKKHYYCTVRMSRSSQVIYMYMHLYVLHITFLFQTSSTPHYSSFLKSLNLFEFT